MSNRKSPDQHTKDANALREAVRALVESGRDAKRDAEIIQMNADYIAANLPEGAVLVFNDSSHPGRVTIHVAVT